MPGESEENLCERRRLAGIRPLRRRAGAGQRCSGLRGASLFDGVPDKVIERIGKLCSEVTVRSGCRLTREGAAGREAFIIRTGEVADSSDGSTLDILGEGEVLGELAPLDAGLRTANAAAMTSTVLLVFAPNEFRSLLLDPTVEQRVLEIAESRRAANGNRPLEPFRVSMGSLMTGGAQSA